MVIYEMNKKKIPLNMSWLNTQSNRLFSFGLTSLLMTVMGYARTVQVLEILAMIILFVAFLMLQQFWGPDFP